MAVGCDDGGQETTNTGGGGPAPLPQGGSGNTAGTSASGGTGNVAGTTGGGTGGTGVSTEGVPLTPDAGGWVDGMGNTLGIQGAMFSYADTTTLATMTGTCDVCESPMTIDAGKVCIKGTAAKVDMNCTPEPPAVDCYGTFWGAAIGLNLHQEINPDTMMGDPPTPYDAAAAGIKGFSFEISGTTVPTSIRFKVEKPGATADSAVEYCTTSMTPILTGPNTVTFDQLVTECWTTGGTPATEATSMLTKIAWQVVTNATSEVPFDFCVSNVRAVMQ